MRNTFIYMISSSLSNALLVDEKTPMNAMSRMIREQFPVLVDKVKILSWWEDDNHIILRFDFPLDDDDVKFMLTVDRRNGTLYKYIVSKVEEYY